MKLSILATQLLKILKKISKTGVNRISVGAITHSAKSFDISLNYLLNSA